MDFLDRNEEKLKAANYIIDTNIYGEPIEPIKIIGVGRIKLFFDHNVVGVFRQGRQYRIGIIDTGADGQLFIDALFDETSNERYRLIEKTNNEWVKRQMELEPLLKPHQVSITITKWLEE